MPRNPGPNAELVRLAIAGIDAQTGELQRQIRELQDKKVELSKLAGGSTAAPAARAGKAAEAAPKKKRRKMSAEARKKLAAAAKARWAKVKASGKKKL
jgi:hypothetical protein